MIKNNEKQAIIIIIITTFLVHRMQSQLNYVCSYQFYHYEYITYH